MKNSITKQDAIKKITEWATHGNGSPSLLISQENSSIHLSYYYGMGNYDNIPIEKLPLPYKDAVFHYYQSGLLAETPEVFSLYPGSGFFKKLILKET